MTGLITSTISGRFSGVQVGDSLWITNGVNYGRYTIASVDTQNFNYVTVNTGLFSQDQSGVDWYVTVGIADCTQAFQDALSAAASNVGGLQSNAGVVYVPKGKYRITSKLTIPLGVSLVGAGRAGTFIIADFAEKTGAAAFVKGSNSVTGITGSLAQYDYVKVAAQDFTALARVESIASGTATLHVNYYGDSGSGYKTVTPVIENATNDISIRNLTIDSAHIKEHIGINFFHSGTNTLENVQVKHMYVGIFVTNSYTNGIHVNVHECRTGIQFGNPGYDQNSGAGWPDWSTCNYFYGGAVGVCSEYGLRFVQAWGNLIYNMDIGYNAGPDMVAPVSLEGVGVCGYNTLMGCFSENNEPCIIKINSAGNNIIGHNLNSCGIGATYTGTSSTPKDDMSAGGSFTGTTPTRYRVEIDGTDTPDTFRWYDQTGPITQFASFDGNVLVTAPGHGLPINSTTEEITIFGTTHYNGSYTNVVVANCDQFIISATWNGNDGTGDWKRTAPNASGVPISASGNQLNNGVTVTFGSTTGHTTADSWFFAGRTIYDLRGNTTGTMLSGNCELTPAGISSDLRLLSSKLGVGTADPAATVHIKGDLSVPLPSLATSSGTQITCNNHGLSAGDGVKLPTGNFGFEIFTVASVIDANNFYVDHSPTWPITDKQGYCDSTMLKIDNGDGENMLTVDKSGNINIENPDNSREIFFSDNGQIRSSDDNHRIIFDRTNNRLELREWGDIVMSEADGTVNMIVRSSGGKVGIGNTSPSKTLHLRGREDGEMLIDDASGWTQAGRVAALYLGDTNAFVKNVQGGSTYFSSNNNLQIVTTYYSKHIALMPSGNVGINKTDPGEKLEVTGNIKGSGAVIIPAVRPVTDGTTALQLQTSGGTSVVNVDTTNSIVGIGNTPSEKLEVTGNIKGSGAVIIPAVRPATDGTTALQLQKANGTCVVTVDTTNSRVGIGTTPSQALDVVGTIKDSVALITPVVKPASDSTTALQLQTSGGTSVVTVDTTNQRVGIGVTPTQKLDVSGNINIAAGSGLKVGGTNQVVGARRTGWTDQTATASRANLGSNPTTAALASFCRALYDDLKAHGLIGN